VGVAVLAFLVAILTLAFNIPHFTSHSGLPVNFPESYSNTKALGTLLFTRYLYPFEVGAMILLVAMISAIALAFFGRKPGTKSQKIGKQHLVTKQDRLRIIKMKPEKS